MKMLDDFFSERYNELGLCPSEMVENGEMSDPLRKFITHRAGDGYVSDEVFDELCDVLHLEPETVLRHIKVTPKDTILQSKYPWAYHPKVTRGNTGKVERKERLHVSKIDALAREARRHSMDYGTYVGMLYLEQEQSVMDRYREYQMRRKLGI